jgi:urease accessory protein
MPRPVPFGRWSVIAGNTASAFVGLACAWAIPDTATALRFVGDAGTTEAGVDDIHFHPIDRLVRAAAEHHRLDRTLDTMKTPLKHLFAGVLLLGALPALAHTSAADASGGFVAGFLHPVLGWDHVVAMVAVGLWGAFLGMPAIWVLPVVFPLVMAAGGALGVAGVPLPGVETGIALSAIVLGAMVALAARPPLLVAAVAVGAFAIFHGHAHGTELPESANPIAFSLGFVVATGLLHVCGITFGLLVRWRTGRIAVRAAGGLIGVVGLGFLFRVL